MRLIRSWFASASVFLTLCCGCGKNAEPTPARNAEPQTINVGGTRIQLATPGMPFDVSVMSPDTLPTAAAFRLGTERGKPPRGWIGAMLLPGGTRVYAQHSLQQPYSFMHYTLYDVDKLKPTGPSILAECESGGGVGDVHSVSADGKRFATVNVKDLEVRDLATGKRVFRMPRPKEGATTMSLSADGKRVATTGPHTINRDVPVTCTVWDVDAGKEIARVTVLQNWDTSVAISPDGKTLITSGSYWPRNGEDPATWPDKISQIWDVDSQTELARVNWQYNRILKFSPDSKTAVLVWYDRKQLLVIDPRTGKTRHTLDLKDVRIGPMAFTADGATLAMVTDTATSWNVATGKRIDTIPKPADLPDGVVASSIAFDNIGRLLAFGSRNLSAYCWDALGGKLLTPVREGHESPVRTVAFAESGKEIRTAGADGVVYRWAAGDGKLLGVIEVKKPDTSRFDVRLSRDGRRAVCESVVYDLNANAPVVDFRAVLKPVGFATAFPAADGAHVVLVGRSESDKPTRCLVYDVAATKVVSEITLPAGPLRASAALGKNPKRLVTTHSTKPVGNNIDLVVTGWDAGRKLGEFTIPSGRGTNGLVLIDDRHAALVTGMGHVMVIDIETGSLIREIPDPTRLSCSAMALSQDGKLIAVAQSGRSAVAKYNFAVRVYDVATGALRHTISTPRGMQSAMLNDFDYLFHTSASPEVMAFSPDGTRLAVPHLTSVLVWDLTKIGPDGEAR